MELTPELKELRENDPAVASILDTFTAVDAVYQQALKAMGAEIQETPAPSNSAEVSLSVGSSSSTAGVIKVDIT